MGLAPMPMGVPGGGLPPGMPAPGGQGMPGAPPANVGPHTIPQNNPGNSKEALVKLTQAADLIGKAIPSVPMGSDMHQKVLKIATDLTKLVGEFRDVASKQEQAQMLVQHLMQMRQQGGQPGGPMPAPPNAGPAMAPPGGAPPPGM